MDPVHLTHLLCPVEQQDPRTGEDEEKLPALTCVVVDQEGGGLQVGSPPQGQEVPGRGELPGTHTLPASHHAQLQHQRKQKNHIEQQTASRKRGINTLKRGVQQKCVQNAFVCWKWGVIFRLRNALLKTFRNFHRIMEYPDFEGFHSDHGSNLWP